MSFVIVHLQILEAQTVTELQNNYSGKTIWDAASGTLTFTNTGTINFNKQNYKNAYWDVPQNVTNIIINENVTVTGAFHTFYNCTIQGKNRKTSVVFGTNEKRWADNRNLDEWNYCQFQNWGGVLNIKNLTSLNSFAFHIRGWGKVNHVKSCDFIDNRGGSGNHSDGFEGGDGSTVDDCYFETGDDIFKIYFDNTITNCTINMIENCVPIQMGWGNYSNGAVGTFKNLKITGTSGRWSPNQTNGVIVGATGTYSITVNINGCYIENPNATLFMLQGTGMTMKGKIDDAYIKVKQYTQTQYNKGSIQTVICNTTQKLNFYDCRISDINSKGKTDQHITQSAICATINQKLITIQLTGIEPKGLLSIYKLNGKEMYNTILNGETSYTINNNLLAGIYIVQFNNQKNIISNKFVAYE